MECQAPNKTLKLFGPVSPRLRAYTARGHRPLNSRFSAIIRPAIAGCAVRVSFVAGARRVYRQFPK